MKIPELRVKVSFKGDVKPSELYKVTTASDAADALRTIFDADTMLWREEVILLCLNRNNKVIGFHKISSGGMDGTVIDVRMVLLLALKTLASSIIMGHNHPSGNLIPSEADKKITNKLKEACKFHDIPLLDHLIISDESYFSFADEGML